MCHAEIYRRAEEREMEEKDLPGHSREDYEACIKYAERHGYWAMHTAITEDGYDPNVDWRSLIEGGRDAD